jgi:hypothetical protein
MKTFTMGILVALLSLSPHTQAGNYLVGVEALDYYPLYRGKGSNYEGYARELLDSFAAASGHTFSYKALPIKRLFSEFIAGNLDLKYPDNPKWAANMKQGQTIIYSDSTVEFIDGIMALKSNNNLNIENFKNIGTLRGFTPWVYMDDISKGTMKLTESTDMKALVSMVESGRTQGAYFNVIVSRYYLNNTLKNPDLLEFKSELPHSRDHFLLSTIKHPELIKQFNEWLKNNNSKVEELKDKYQVNLP